MTKNLPNLRRLGDWVLTLVSRCCGIATPADLDRRWANAHVNTLITDTELPEFFDDDASDSLWIEGHVGVPVILACLDRYRRDLGIGSEFWSDELPPFVHCWCRNEGEEHNWLRCKATDEGAAPWTKIVFMREA
jgi:hypothetical protein